MYLDTRDIEDLIDVYSTAWEKGLKTTYYLHMKPRHTAEQSTVKVNKREKLGKVGFGALKREVTAQNVEIREVKPEPVADANAMACPVDPQERLQCDSCQ